MAGHCPSHDLSDLDNQSFGQHRDQAQNILTLKSRLIDFKYKTQIPDAEAKT